MIFQTDPRLNWEIQSEGCNVMVCFWFGALKTNFEVSTDKINRFVDRWVRMNYLRADMLILDYNPIYRDMGLAVKYRDVWDPPDYVCADHEFEHLCFADDRGKHFTAGNGAGAVTYDPMKDARTIRDGHLDSVRIMEIL